MNEVLKLIKARRSVRSYMAKPVDPKIIKEIIDCARYAPTARNEQPWEFVVVTQKAILAKIAQATDHGRFIKDAACCVVVLCHPTKYFLEDGSAATMNIILAAEVMGLGSCWVAGHKKGYVDRIKAILGVPEDLIVISMVALGYSDEKPSVSKKPLEKIVHMEGWGQWGSDHEEL